MRMEEIESPEMSQSTKALHFAVRTGSVALVKFLLWTGANVNSQSRRGRSALHLACESEHEDMERVVDALLEAEAEVNVQSFGGETPLHTACRSINSRAVTTLLRHGAKVGLVNDNDRTPLHVVAAMTMNNATLPIVHALLANTTAGCEDTETVINLQDASGNTALHLASASNLEEVVRLLLNLGAKVGVKNNGGMTALHWASRACAGDVVDILVDKGEDVNAKDESGNTPLHIACIGNNKEVVCFLLRKGATLGIKNSSGMTAFHTAVKYDSRDVVDVFVDNGEDVNVKDSFGNTPLHQAATSNNKEVAEILLRGGANTGVKNDKGMTALHLAVKALAEDVIGVFVDNGEDINAKDLQGDTPLHVCSHIDVKHSTKSICKLTDHFLSKGAKEDEKKNRLKTLYEELGDRLFHDGIEAVEMIEETFIKQVIRLQTLGLQEEFDVNWRLGPFFYDNVRDRCYQEIENMKSTTVVKDISLYEVFTHRNQPFPRKNDDLILPIDEYLCSPDLLKRFPIYGDALRTTFQRAKLLTLAVLSLYTEHRKQMVKELPREAAEHLVTFLSNADLRSLIEASSPN